MKLIIPLLLLLCSCSLQKKMVTGTYTIKSVVGDEVTFKEVKGIFVIPNDTLKVHDKIIVNVIRLQQ